jgi:hypothetical protein
MFIRIFKITNNNDTPVDLTNGLIIQAGETVTPQNQWWITSGYGLAALTPNLSFMLSDNRVLQSNTQEAYDFCVITFNYFSGYYELFTDIQTLSTSVNLVIGDGTFNLQGPQGVQGAQGAQGTQGAQGGGTSGALTTYTSVSGPIATCSSSFETCATLVWKATDTKVYLLNWSAEVSNKKAKGKTNFRLKQNEVAISGDPLQVQTPTGNHFVPVSGLALCALVAGETYTWTFQFAAESHTAMIRNIRLAVLA